MAKCPSCGADVTDGMKFCCECGSRIPQDKECPACHAHVSVEMRFCPECGQKLSSAAGAASRPLSGIGGMPAIGGFRHSVKCHVCGCDLSIIEANTCIDCHQYVCNDHYDKAAHLCHSCLKRDDEDVQLDDSAAVEVGEESQVGSSCGAGITYQDVFNRVKEYLEDNGGYDPEVDDDDGTVSMVMDDDGMTYMYWDSVEDFLVAPWEDHHANFDQPGCAGIFEIAGFWDCKYEKLIRWAAVFIDNCGKLARVDISDKTPAALMRALDDAGIGIESSEDPDDSSDDDSGVDANDDEDAEEEESSSSDGHYSVILKDCGDNKGAVLRDLVDITGMGLMAIGDMLENLPAVIAKGLTRDKADLYYGGLLLDGAKAEIVADEDDDDDSDEGDDSPSEPYPEMVEIPGRNFKLGCTPVTQAQWKAVMGHNPSYFTYKGANRPVEQVSWDDCQEFIEKLNEQTGMNFRLPTQKEWEYACRAGSKGDYGLVEGGEEGDIDDMGWYDGNSDDETHPVAQKQPNAWGLYDMHGNVSTWCADEDGEYHVVCGGAFNFSAESCTSEYQNGSTGRDNWIGLRLAMDGAADSGDNASDVEDSSSNGFYSVVLKKCKSIDNMVIYGREIYKGLGYDAYDFRKFISTPPAVLARKVSREEADKIVSTLGKYGILEIVPAEIKDGEIDFDGIQEYIKNFKRSVSCNDIVLPAADSFDKKWNNIADVILKLCDRSVDPDDALAILDCTVFGSAKNGVLIDKSGIYTNNDNHGLSGWLTWDDFKASGHITKNGAYDVYLMDDPSIGINVSGCGLSTADTIRFFKGLLSIARGEG